MGYSPGMACKRDKGRKPDLEALLRAELKRANCQVAVVCNEGTMCVRRWVYAGTCSHA